ncbi:MAG: universal stress protein [Cyclobacteriaceae bacterium]|nr:universal stress protein [Cyclobacteriaceae bacterium]UYN87983.1 MAG: universal stress protein [Cyclobacteriaceae bacterium]
MKVILCALDFSEVTENVIREAFKLAAKKRASLIFLYAYRLLQRKGESLSAYRNGVEAKAKEDFEKLIKTIGYTMDVPFAFITEIGFLSDRIESYMGKNNVAAIVLCEKLAETLNEQKDVSLEDFIHGLKIPVVIIPEVHEVG